MPQHELAQIRKCFTSTHKTENRTTFSSRPVLRRSATNKIELSTGDFVWCSVEQNSRYVLMFSKWKWSKFTNAEMPFGPFVSCWIVWWIISTVRLFVTDKSAHILRTPKTIHNASWSLFSVYSHIPTLKDVVIYTVNITDYIYPISNQQRIACKPIAINTSGQIAGLLNTSKHENMHKIICRNCVQHFSLLSSICCFS